MQVETIRFKSGAGDKLTGDLYHGRNGTPLFLFSHGMLSNRSGKATFMAELAVKAGCTAFTFDFGGCGGSGGEFYPISYGRRSADLDAAIETALRISGASKLVLVGSSMGGALSISAAERTPAVAAVFALAPPDDGSALEAAETIGKPLFIIHGDKDEIVSPERSAGIARAAGKHARRRLEHGAGHSLEDRMSVIGPEIIEELMGILSVPGCYQLLVRLDRILPGSTGGRSRPERNSLPPGFYAYSGSGGASLEGRVARHIRTARMKPEKEHEPGTGPGQGTGIEPDSRLKPGTEADLESWKEPGTETKLEPVQNPKGGPESGTGTKLEPALNPEAELEPGMSLGPGTRAKSERGTDLEASDTFHWHIDRLLSSPDATLVAAFRFPLPSWPGPDEHLLHSAAAAIPGAAEPDPGFGSSDCRGGCRSHLVKLPAASAREAKTLLTAVHKRMPHD